MPFCLGNYNHRFPYRIKPDCDFYLRNNNKICSGHKYTRVKFKIHYIADERITLSATMPLLEAIKKQIYIQLISFA